MKLTFLNLTQELHRKYKGNISKSKNLKGYWNYG